MSEETLVDTKTQFSQIEEVFNIADKISKSDIQEYKDKRLEEIELKEVYELTPAEFNAKNMYEAFKETHQVFRESLKLSKQMLSKIHENLMVFDEELSPEMVAAYASLQKNITDSLKTISQSFKLLTEAKANLEPKPTKEDSGTTNIENANIIMTHGVNTHKLIEQFKT
jgi:hypothetical protein